VRNRADEEKVGSEVSAVTVNNSGVCVCLMRFDSIGRHWTGKEQSEANQSRANDQKMRNFDLS
jgi:hypothetical protein